MCDLEPFSKIRSHLVIKYLSIGLSSKADVRKENIFIY